MAKINDVSRVQKELALVQKEIKVMLDMYKKANVTPEEKLQIVTSLKDLNSKKKKLDANLEMLISKLHQDAELDVDAAENF